MTLYRQGKVPGLVLRRLRPGGRVGRSDLGDGRARPAVHPAPRPRGAHHPRRRRRRASSPSTWAATDGITRGRDGNVHFGDRTKGCVGMVSMLPDMMLDRDRPRDGVQAARRAARRDDVVRRRLDLPRRLPRGHELGRRAEAPDHLRAGEQPVRVLDAAERAVRGRPRRARRRLRLPGRQASTATTPRRCSRRPQGARARARRRGPDADRGRDHAHARPRRARRHEVRAEGAGRGVAREGPDRPPGAPARGARRRRPGASATRSRPTIDAAVERGAGLADARPEHRDRPPLRRRAALLEDGDAPWSGFAKEA